MLFEILFKITSALCELLMKSWQKIETFYFYKAIAFLHKAYHFIKRKNGDGNRQYFIKAKENGNKCSMETKSSKKDISIKEFMGPKQLRGHSIAT